MTTWPPTLADLKDDLGIDVSDTRDDAKLTRRLDAAVAFVQRRRTGINYTGDELSDDPAPDDDLVLGTLMLAGRLNTRRRSPDGLISAGELGTSRVPGVDADIERLLRIGRFAKPAVG